MVLSSQWRNAKSELDQLRRSLPPVGPELELWRRHQADPVAWVLDNKLLPGLDDWQRSALRSKSRQAIWLINRQGGKSSIASLIALHQSIFHPGSLTLMVSRSIRQSSELYRKFVGFYSMLDSPPPMLKSTVIREPCPSYI